MISQGMEAALSWPKPRRHRHFHPSFTVNDDHPKKVVRARQYFGN